MSEENKIIKNDIEELEDMKKKLLKQQDQENNFNFKKDILSLFSKFQERLEMQDDLNKALDESFLKDIQDNNDDFTPLCRLKLKEILCKYSTDTFAPLTRMITEVMKYGMDLENDKDKNLNLSKEEVQDLLGLYNLLKDIKTNKE